MSVEAALIRWTDAEYLMQSVEELPAFGRRVVAIQLQETGTDVGDDGSEDFRLGTTFVAYENRLDVVNGREHLPDSAVIDQSEDGFLEGCFLRGTDIGIERCALPDVIEDITLPSIVTDILAESFQFVTLDDVLQSCQITRNGNVHQSLPDFLAYDGMKLKDVDVLTIGVHTEFYLLFGVIAYCFHI